MAKPQFEIVEEREEVKPSGLATAALLLGLRALSQRALVALADCFSLITVATVFWISMSIIPYEPSTHQLAGLAGYAIFIVAVNVIVRRSK